MKQHLLILGVTASGKGRLGLELARHIGAEIISVDSMKIYRRMNIGTGKPAPHVLQTLKHHLIDIVEPSQSFSAGSFLEMATTAIEHLDSINKPVIAVGGTALYIKSLLYGLFNGPGADENIRNKLKKQIDSHGLAQLYLRLQSVDPPAAERINRNDQRRIIRALEVYELTGRPISDFQTQFDDSGSLGHWTIIGLRRQKDDASGRINKRVKKMFDDGLTDEVRSLLAEDKPMSKQAASAIGYAEIIEYLSGRTSLDEAIERIKINTRRLAKHQRTWFRTFKTVNWLDITADEPHEQILECAKEILRSSSL